MSDQRVIRCGRKGPEGYSSGLCKCRASCVGSVCYLGGWLVGFVFCFCLFFFLPVWEFEFLSSNPTEPPGELWEV